MIDPNLVNETSAAKRRAVVKEQVRKDLTDGSFTITETLLVKEPLRSDAWEAVDGVVVEGTRSMGMYDEPMTSGTVKLVCFHPPGTKDERGQPIDTIKFMVTEERRIPGTTETRKVKVQKSFGNFADVPDNVPTRLARNILYRDGWPIRQLRSGGDYPGKVIEWRWLEKEIKSGIALPEYQELYDEIRSRPGFLEFIGEAPKKTDARKDKTTA